jgi:tetratricopeptide (TPR) repeat protein
MLLGDHDAAERLLGEALAAPVYSERALQWMSPERRKRLDQDEDAHLEDARIHTLRARLLAERGDLGGVEKALAAAEKLLDSPERQAGAQERLVLRGRLDLARGDARAAYERLRVGLHRWFFDAEGYAMLSIAAHLTGHDRIADQALERAERRGVDVRALKEVRRAAQRP